MIMVCLQFTYTFCVSVMHLIAKYFDIRVTHCAEGFFNRIICFCLQENWNSFYVFRTLNINYTDFAIGN